MSKVFCYIKTRKKGTINWKAIRENGKIIVFDSYDNAKGYIKDSGDSVYKIMPLLYHPMHKRSRIYRKKYKKIGW